jgi:hypothetical protein
MNLDARIKTTRRPMYGCHTELDHLRTEDYEFFVCDFTTRHEEKACQGCGHKFNERAEK